MEGKEGIILNTALDLFLSKGYENTNLKDIINITGGSYTTIYKKFKNKNQLFLKAIQKGANERIEKLKNIVFDNFDLELEDFLEQFAREYFSFFYSDYNINFLRLIVSRSYHDKTLQELINKSDRALVTKELAKYFEKKIDKKVLEEIKPIELATLYCSIIRADNAFNVLANVKLEKPNKEEIKSNIKIRNNFFLKAITYKM